MWLNGTREGGGTGEHRRARCEAIALGRLSGMEIFCVGRVEARGVESEKGYYCDRTYPSSGLLGAKPALAIHDEAEDA